jgi:hypothetical protein
MKTYTVKKGTILIDKLCTKCKVIESHTSKGKHCRKCVASLSRKHLLLNKEHRKGYYKKWRGDNSEGLRVAKKKYYDSIKNTPEFIEKRRLNKLKGRNKEVERDYSYRVKYGITLKDYNEMYTNQEGKCKICNLHYDKLNVDHCHTNGNVRGLLCNTCNTGIGLLKDDISILKNAINYLNK